MDAARFNMKERTSGQKEFSQFFSRSEPAAEPPVRSNVIEQMEIGRRVSQLMSENRNPRRRSDALEGFIQLIEKKGPRVEKVMKHRKTDDIKRQEIENFIGALEDQAQNDDPKKAKLAGRLLQLIHAATAARQMNQKAEAAQTP